MSETETPAIALDAPAENTSDTAEAVPSIEAPTTDTTDARSEAEMVEIARQYLPGGKKDEPPVDTEPTEEPTAPAAEYVMPADGAHAFDRLQVPQDLAKKWVADITASHGAAAAAKFVDAIQARATYTDRLSRENAELRQQLQQAKPAEAPPAAKPTQPNESKRFKALAEMYGEEQAGEIIAEEQEQLQQQLRPLQEQLQHVTAQREAEYSRREQADTAAGLEEAAKEISPSTLADPAKKQEIIAFAHELFRNKVRAMQQAGTPVNLDTFNLRQVIPQAARALYPVDVARRERAKLATNASKAIRSSPDGAIRASGSSPRRNQEEIELEAARDAITKHKL